VFGVSDDDKWAASLLAISGRLIDVCRIKFVTSVGTLGRDLDDFQVSIFGLFAHYHSDWHSESHRFLA
jgi:hypothetical protein